MLPIVLHAFLFSPSHSFLYAFPDILYFLKHVDTAGLFLGLPLLFYCAQAHTAVIYLVKYREWLIKSERTCSPQPPFYQIWLHTSKHHCMTAFLKSDFPVWGICYSKN